MSDTVGEAVPPAQRGSWSSFLKSIASFSGDLSSLTAPPFILSPVSLTEFPAYWCEHPDIFAAIADAIDPEARALAVLKWFISTLKGQYTSRNESMGSEKKPLNPVLGELFYGQWPDANGRGRTDLLVEQVSHHPPITAYLIQNSHKGLRLVGHNAQKTSFSAGSIIVKQIGHAVLTVPRLNGQPPDEYLITLPRLRIDGLWYGSPYIELADTSYIIGGGFVSTIEYKGKGYFSGKSHSFKATVTPAPGSGGSAREHVVEGVWHLNSRFTKGPHASSSAHFHDVETVPKLEVSAVGGGPSHVPTINPDLSGDGGVDAQEMGEFETRRLWALVAKGIREGDFETASREKSRIENEQRQRRRDEVAAEMTWALKHFEHKESDPVYERLGKLVKITPPTEDAYLFQENWPARLPAAADGAKDKA